MEEKVKQQKSRYHCRQQQWIVSCWRVGRSAAWLLPYTGWPVHRAASGWQHSDAYMKASACELGLYPVTAHSLPKLQPQVPTLPPLPRVSVREKLQQQNSLCKAFVVYSRCQKKGWMDLFCTAQSHGHMVTGALEQWRASSAGCWKHDHILNSGLPVTS